MRIPNALRAAGISAAVLMVSIVTAAAGLPAPDKQPQPAHHRIEIRDFRFVPERLTVVPGDTVTWVNHDIVPHTVTATDQRWDSEELAPNAEWAFVVPDGIGRNYFCRYHPTMRGVVDLPRR